MRVSPIALPPTHFSEGFPNNSATRPHGMFHAGRRFSARGLTRISELGKSDARLTAPGTCSCSKRTRQKSLDRSQIAERLVRAQANTRRGKGCTSRVSTAIKSGGAEKSLRHLHMALVLMGYFHCK